MRAGMLRQTFRTVKPQLDEGRGRLRTPLRLSHGEGIDKGHPTGQTRFPVSGLGSFPESHGGECLKSGTNRRPLFF